jgi:2-haloacid dehalogenase
VCYRHRVPPLEPRALIFDVFGTCVDWRGSIIAEGPALDARWGTSTDWAKLADAWRGRYQPALEEVRSGRRSWTILDVLHRESLDALAPSFGLDKLDEAARDHLNRIWHRLRPWPDTVAGLTRLKARFVLGPLSNGNFALLTNMAKHAGLPWDVNLSVELYRAYKPLPASYLGAVGLLGLEPRQVMMVAAHYSDLQAAAACGLRTAYVHRPREFGDRPPNDLPPDPRVDLIAKDFEDLATQLRC